MSAPFTDTPPANSLRGEFTATLGGAVHRFETTLGAVARIEEACGGRSIIEIVGGVVSDRRAADQITLIAAALRGAGAVDADAVAARTLVPEAEAFILSLMGALGFRLTPRSGEAQAADRDDPLPGPSAGGAGAPSRSAD